MDSIYSMKQKILWPGSDMSKLKLINITDHDCESSMPSL